ncbi:MAG: lipid A export permease/ATP-binding protein MsbA [Candidatus Competibacterales bacterium]
MTSPSPTLYRRLLGQVLPYRLAFAGAVVCTLLLGAVEPLIAALVEPLLDGSFVARDPFYVTAVPAALAGLFLLRGVLGFAAGVGLKWVAQQVVMDLRRAMFQRLLQLPPARCQTDGGALLSRFTYDVAQVTQAATQALVVLGRDSVAIVGLLGYLLYLDWALSTVMLLLAPLVAWVVGVASRRLRRVSRDLQGRMGQLNALVEEVIRGFPVIKTFNAQERELARFEALNHNLQGDHVKLAVAAEASAPIVQSLAVVALAAVIYLAARQAAAGAMTVGEFGSLFAAMTLLLAPIKRLTRINEVIQRGLAAAESVFALIDETPEGDPGGPERSKPGPRGEIHFQGVSFGYDPHNPVLADLHLTIPAGATVALVGASGSGKSTLLQLLLRFVDPQRGRITIDGLEVGAWPLATLRHTLAYVGQEVVLFDRSVAANIAFGALDDGPGEGMLHRRVVAAARAAAAAEFIEALPEGYGSPVGPNGSRLSGGQRQRLALARAFFKDADILLLDEATAALDAATEGRIQGALKGLRRGKTTLIVAHRLSAIEGADAIAVLHGGRVVEWGSHRELLARNGVYAGLYRLQTSVAEAKALGDPRQDLP